MQEGARTIATATILEENRVDLKSQSELLNESLLGYSSPGGWLPVHDGFRNFAWETGCNNYEAQIENKSQRIFMHVYADTRLNALQSVQRICDVLNQGLPGGDSDSDSTAE